VFERDDGEWVYVERDGELDYSGLRLARPPPRE